MGETRLVCEDAMKLDLAALAEQGAMVVQVACDRGARGKLGEKIEARIETELSARGASSPGMGADDGPSALLSDQLFRARKLGHRALCLSLTGLERLAEPVGGLDAVDARALRFYAFASRERPVTLLLPENAVRLVAFAAPVPLVELIGLTEPRLRSSPPVALVAAPARVADTAPRELPGAAPVTETPVVTNAAAPAEAIAAVAPLPAAAPTRRAQPVHDLASRMRSGARVAPAAPAPPAPPPAPARAVIAEAEFRPWIAALEAARGPQPLATFERLFAESYMPLTNAIARGLADQAAIAAQSEFHRTFSRAYAEACPTFALTGKRPKMVFDAHELAKRLTRTHDARAAHLILVDAMRWDVGTLVKEHLTRELAGRASLASDAALFAALPSVTGRQLEALTRGVEALRQPFDAEREADPLRARTAEVIRRVKVGSRDVYKLDVIEAGLAKASGHALELIPELAKAAAEAIARQVKTLPARTLVYVFGDHGFVLDAAGAAHHGGAAPEEVIVPAFAWLTGEPH